MKIDFYKIITVLLLLCFILLGIFYVKLNRFEYMAEPGGLVRIDRLTGNVEDFFGEGGWRNLFKIKEKKE